MPRDDSRPRLHDLEAVTFSARRTELAWTFHRPYDDVWDAAASSAHLAGLALLAADRKAGLAVAKPPFSLLNVGRRVALTFSRMEEDRTLVRATLLHGLLSLQSRSSRERFLDGVLRAALAELRRADQAGPPSPPAPAASEIAAPTPPASAPTLSSDAPPAPAAEADAPGQRLPSAPPSAPSPPAAAPGEENAPNLEEMDFGHADWNNLPLTPPRGPQASAFRRGARQAGGLRIWRSVGWFVLGLGLALAAYALTGGLSFLWH